MYSLQCNIGIVTPLSSVSGGVEPKSPCRPFAALVERLRVCKLVWPTCLSGRFLARIDRAVDPPCCQPGKDCAKLRQVPGDRGTTLAYTHAYV